METGSGVNKNKGGLEKQGGGSKKGGPKISLPTMCAADQWEVGQPRHKFLAHLTVWPHAKVGRKRGFHRREPCAACPASLQGS